MAMEKPLPSAPIRLEAGMRQSSNTTSQVLEVRMPILSSSWPVDRPGVPASTKNIDMPFTPADLSVMAVTQ